MSLTIAYTTSRKEPKFEWFFSSLGKQANHEGGLDIQIVIVDFYADLPGRDIMVYAMADRLLGRQILRSIIFTPPKPTVWQGPHRLTSVDYFAAASGRNTALCLAPTDWIAYVDDLSVLMPGWLAAAEEAMKREHTITLGAYQKVFDLKVENGVVSSFREDLNGIDIRNRKHKTGPTACKGEWHWGSSLVAPVEAYLSINGWDENCDGMGYEDVVTGQLLENAGWKFVYDPRMLTWEDQELHQQEPRMMRLDKGVSPNDKSHAILESARGRKWAANYFGEEGIRGLRQRILAGESFPIVSVPAHDWYDSQPLSEM